MSPYLAIDTATDVGSVAVGQPGALASEVQVGARRHAAGLVPAVDEALRLAGASLPDISGILVADGPGSFTGLRIGFSTVQGLVRQRADLPVMTAPSLLSTAVVASPFVAGAIAVLYDALRGEVYAAVYQFRGGKLDTLLGPCLTTVRSLTESGVPVVLAVGDGASAYAEDMRRWTGHDPSPAGSARAYGLIELMRVAGGLRQLDDVTTWEPDYGRPAEAQVRWERAHGKPLPGSVGDRG